ncbi:hypothetical protein FACUT_2919 [Fusarium acutatum]|uniref:Uncharacterized protein n=1 Tax=Fusarium acutatum TaxID=78861 RepID=A0A8H4NR29_9HYPO|nr:hypothetical protein FACUT_2919 [Fusarium acutatum]
MGQPKYRQMTAQYGAEGHQDVNLGKGLLTYTLFIDFSDPDKAMGKLWKVLGKMKVFDDWEATHVFGIRVKDNGKCDYFDVPAPPAKSTS